MTKRCHRSSYSVGHTMYLALILNPFTPGSGNGTTRNSSAAEVCQRTSTYATTGTLYARGQTHLSTCWISCRRQGYNAPVAMVCQMVQKLSLKSLAIEATCTCRRLTLPVCLLKLSVLQPALAFLQDHPCLGVFVRVGNQQLQACILRSFNFLPDD